MKNKRIVALLLSLSMILAQGQIEGCNVEAKQPQKLSIYRGKTEVLRIVQNGKKKKTGSSYRYQGYNKKVVSITGTGKIKAKKAGTTNVVLVKKSTGKKTKIKVKVVDHVKSLKLLSSTNIVLEQGKKKSIQAVVYPKTAKNRQVSYKSSDSRVVTVNEKGTVQAVATGFATITVTTKGINKKGKKIAKKINVGVLGDTSPIPTPYIPGKEDDVIIIHTPVPSSVPTVTATATAMPTATSQPGSDPEATPSAIPTATATAVPLPTATGKPTQSPSTGGEQEETKNSLQEMIDQIPKPASSTLVAATIVAKGTKGTSTLYFINRNYQGNMHVSVDGIQMSSDSGVAHVLKRMATEVTGKGVSKSVNPGNKQENKYYDEKLQCWMNILWVSRGTLADAWLITNRKKGNKYRLSAWETDTVYGTPYGLIITEGDTTSDIVVY